MNACDLTFGVELEVTLPYDQCPPIGSYHHGVQVPGLPEGWVAKTDGSIRARGEHAGVEIVSPVLKGAEGLAQVKLAVEWIKARGGRVNRSCGFHVHVGCSRDLLPKLTHLVANNERGIYAATGTKNRERGSFCRPIQNDPAMRGRFAEEREAQSRYIDRYHSLNVTNLFTGTKPTVEFRAFAGTLNLAKIVGYIRLCLGLVEKAAKMKRTTAWTPKPTAETSPLHRSGEGQTALTRLYYSLGWIKGREDYAYGDFPAEGLPTLQRIRRELMKLARKYDAAS